MRHADLAVSVLFHLAYSLLLVSAWLPFVASPSPAAWIFALGEVIGLLGALAVGLVTAGVVALIRLAGA